MKRLCILLGAMVFAFSSTVFAGENFRIKTLRDVRSTDLILVGRNWVKDPRRLLVALRVENDTPATAISIRAYFYDKDGKEVARVEEPNHVWTRTPRGIEDVGLPATLEKNKDIEVYFALTQELEAKKWKSIVVVFGNDTKVAARSYPATAIASVDFPEKSKMIKE